MNKAQNMWLCNGNSWTKLKKKNQMYKFFSKLNNNFELDNICSIKNLGEILVWERLKKETNLGRVAKKIPF